MIECIVLAASICLNEDASVQSMSHGFFSGAVITLGDVVITSELSSDNVGIPNRSKMQQACEDSTCFHYRLRCSVPSDIRALCEVDYATPDMREVRRLSVEASNGEQIIAAASRVLLVPPDGTGVRLADLGFEAAIAAAPRSPLATR